MASGSRQTRRTILIMNTDTLLRFHALRQELIEERDAIQQRLCEISAVLADGPSGTKESAPVTAASKGRTAAPAKSKGKRAARGAMKEAIVAALQKAGVAGISVKQLAQDHGFKEGNVSVWFYTTGKKIKNISKVGRGTFGWKA